MKRLFSIDLWMHSGSHIPLSICVDEDEIDELVSDLRTIEEAIENNQSARDVGFRSVDGYVTVDVSRVEAIRWNDKEWTDE